NNNSNNDNNHNSPPRSPPVPALQNKERKGSLPMIFTPRESEFIEKSSSEDNVKPAKRIRNRKASLTVGRRPNTTDSESIPKINSITRPVSRATVLPPQPPVDSEHVPIINSVTRPCSKSSINMTPRRLPPMPSSPYNTSQQPGSPVINTIDQKQLENSLNSRSIETLTLLESRDNIDKITPVEVTPRISSSMTKAPPSPSPISLSTSNDSSIEISIEKDKRKKESADSGVYGLLSRPSSSSSMIEEQLAASISSSSQDSSGDSMKRPKDLTGSAEEVEKWIVLKSLSSIR
ncbi:hypothetical protein Avbf_15795, partial [Armadillidium vulgare]